MIITRWQRLLNTTGERLDVAIDVLFAEFSKENSFIGDAHPGWSAAEFKGNKRGKENVLGVTAAVLDYDGVTTIEHATEQWRGLRGLLHTTKSHTSDLHSFRIILPFMRAVSWFEWEAIWRRLDAHTGGMLDSQAKDASRFWYVPGVAEGGEFLAVALAGSELDPDEWLRKPEPAPAYTAPTPEYDFRPEPSTGNRDKRICGYLATMDPAIQGQRGHTALLRVAIKLVHGFECSDSEALSIILLQYNPLCVPPFSRDEIVYKITEARTEAKTRNRVANRPSSGGASGHTPSQGAPESKSPPLEPPGSENAPAGQLEALPSMRVLTVKDLLTDSLIRVKDKTAVRKCTTGVWGLDDATGGMRPGHVWVFGADTNWGKSSFLIMIADENLKSGKRVLIVTSEDDQSLYGDRLMVRRAKVNAKRYRNRCPTDDELRKVEAIEAAARPDPVFVDARGKTAEEVAQMVGWAIDKHSIDLVAYDYLQEFRSAKRGLERRIEVAEVASTLRTVVKKRGKTGIIFSQITVSDGKKVPDKHSIRESRDVSNAAEAILMGFTPTEDIARIGAESIKAGTKCVFVDKVKDGPKGFAIPMTWDPESACFDVVAKKYSDARDQRATIAAQDIGDFGFQDAI